MSALNFSWVGAAPYTPPNGDALNFSWAGADPLPDPPPVCKLRSLHVQSLDWAQDGEDVVIDIRLRGKLR